jgi:pimeloyl-ACP methyl ester carboxylesterase
MPTLDFMGRTLCYEHFGAPTWDDRSPVFVFVSSEYRDTLTMMPILRQMPDQISGVIVDSTNMGGSTRLDRPLTRQEVIAELTHACQALKIHRPVFIGYCSTAELALHATTAMDGAGLLVVSPFFRRRASGLVDMFYAALKRTILARDAYTLTVLMNLVDPHSRALRETENHFLKDQFANQKLLQDADHFWIKTLQCKPAGDFAWDDLSAFARRVLILRGSEDTLQPITFLSSQLRDPWHELVEFENGHQILNHKLPDVVRHMCAFSQSLRLPDEALVPEAAAWTN